MKVVKVNHYGSKEAIKILAEESCKGCKDLEEDNTCIGSTECFEAKRMAISALEKQEKYKWHDLRKDDMDMPFDGRMVLWKLDNGYYFTDWVENDKLSLSGCVFGEVENQSRIIAWKEIEPFEEGGTE